jgi:hypothetical protein
MDVRELTLLLKHADQGSPELDEAVALAHGWTVEKLKTTGKGPNVLWISPSGKKSSRPSRYSQNLDAALALAQETEPNQVGGCGWEPATATARINLGPYCQAATPMLALCVASMHAKIRRAQLANES